MRALAESSDFEAVHFVEGFADGVLNGTADYQGAPHHFVLRSAEPNAAEVYELTPLSADVFGAVTETWDIWRRWQAAQHAGFHSASGAPLALPEDRERQAELRSVISNWLAAAKPFAFLAEGDFEQRAVEGLSVKWRRLPSRE